LLGLIEVIPAEDHLLIENVAVRPDQQGKGLAKHFYIMRKASPARLVSKKSSFTQILFLLRTWHFTLGADIESIDAGR